VPSNGRFLTVPCQSMLGCNSPPNVGLNKHISRHEIQPLSWRHLTLMTTDKPARCHNPKCPVLNTVFRILHCTFYSGLLNMYDVGVLQSTPKTQYFINIINIFRISLRRIFCLFFIFLVVVWRAIRQPGPLPDICVA